MSIISTKGYARCKAIVTVESIISKYEVLVEILTNSDLLIEISHIFSLSEYRQQNNIIPEQNRQAYMSLLFCALMEGHQ